MNLTERLIATNVRETAGSRSSNRFAYQQVWALNHTLELIRKDRNFIIFMEFHDDVIILDTSYTSSIEFFQIKTDDSASRYFTVAKMVKDSEKYPDKMSILQKLITNYTNFKDETTGLHLVSNKSFDLKELYDGNSSVERDQIRLDEIATKELSKIQKGMCEGCYQDNGTCKDICSKIIFFDVSNLDLVNFEDTVLARFINFVDEQGFEITTRSAKSMYQSILGEFRRINNREGKSRTFEELIQNKSISKENFLAWLADLKFLMSKDQWNYILAYLLQSRFNPFEVDKIMKQWKKYSIDSMDVDNSNLKSIEDIISSSVKQNICEDLKERMNIVFRSVKEEPIITLYEKEYIYAIILKELFV